jgi:hypothetical protein
MSSVTDLILAVEDQVSEAALRRVVGDSLDLQIVKCMVSRGFGQLKSRALSYNQCSVRFPVILLTDLDRAECPPGLLEDWLGEAVRQPNFLLRVAVRSVESWVMADSAAFAEFFAVPSSVMPRDTDAIRAPKQFLIDLVRRKSRRRSVRDDVVPRPGRQAIQGAAYNEVLCQYLSDCWNPEAASIHSQSLAKTIMALERLARRAG